MSSIVYKYSLSAPDDECVDRVFDQLRAAHAYAYDLTFIERAKRAAVRGLLDAETTVEIETARGADQVAAEAGAVVRAARAKDRTLKVDTTLRDIARATARVARQALITARKEARGRLETDLLEIEERARELRKSVREYTSLYWGSYLLVEEASTRAFAAPLYQEDGFTPNDPDLPRWDGSGTLGVQLQGGLSAVRACGGTDTRLRIDAPPPAAWAPNDTPYTPRPPGQGYRHQHLVRMRQDSRVHLRVGSTANGKPVWASWEMDMHRPLPEGSIIKWATIHRMKNGPFYSWHLCVTLALNVTSIAPRAGSVAIDVGWRQVEGDIRVCRWIAADGAQGELRLSAEDIRVLKAPREIRSQRDSRLETIRTSVGRWLRAWPKVPEAVRLAAQNLHVWRSPAKFVRLLRAWGDNRFEGDEIPFCALEAYCAQDLLDWRTETSWRTSALGRRRCKYQMFAAKLAQMYGTIVLERFDLNKPGFARYEEDSAENETARGNRFLVATSELRDALCNAARTRGGVVALVSAVNTTRTCRACGLVEKFDAAASIDRVCGGCGELQDQDDSAGSILLKRWIESPGDARIVVGARKEKKTSDGEEAAESRWAKARRLGAAKKAKIEAARKGRGKEGET